MSEDLALDTVAEADATPQKAVRRWLLEIKLAQKREKDWRQTANKLLDTYRGRKKKKNSFNILWANTEILRPSLYNSTPKPDVRRRFRQSDVLGKAVSEVMERSLTYCVDAYDLDNCLQNDVLDALLPGRGLSRVRYVPTIKQGDPEQAYEGDREEVEYEQALCEHVQWDDFLHGPGKTWEEVQWNGFRHRLTKDDIIEKFGEEIANEVRLDDVEESELNDSNKNEDLKEVFKRGEFWEIWDKEGKRVFFVNESYKKGPIYPKDAPDGEPPLALKNFFPVPRPLQLVEDTGTLIPEPLYELYREQAEELDRVSARINKIVNACRVRFVHDSTLTELKALMDASDNEGIPAESARAWMANGGIEKAIWFMPVQHIAQVLKELYIAREGAKQVIYEITGISDIIRGQSDPNETLGAQKLKANSSSLRLQRMQREVQRYTRDLIRLLAEVIGENFDSQTLAQMTGLQFATGQQKQMLQMQVQAMQQQQQPVPPQLQNALKMPSWDEIMAVLQSDIQREYKVDVETDSTVAQSLEQDMEGIREVYTGLVELWNGVGPAVQSGALSIEVVKAMSLSLARRARMGLEVEDALETGMQPPKPQADPNAAKEAEETQRMQAEAQKEQAIAQREQQNHQAEAAAKAAENEHARALDAQQKEHDRQIRAMELEKEAELKRYEIDQNNAAKITVAEIAADASLMTAQTSADTAVQTAGIKADASVQTAGIGAEAKAEGQAAKTGGSKAIERFVNALMEKVTPMLDQQSQALAQQGQEMIKHGESVAHVIDYLNAPKTAERDATGRLVRLIPQMTTPGPLSRGRNVQRDASGRPVTIQ